MNTDEFNALRAQAAKLYESQPGRDGKHRISLDTVFLALAGRAQSTPAPSRKAADEPPEWFKDTLERLRGSGEKVTVGRFLLLAGQFPATRSDTLNTGRWLREAGIEPKKIGGNLLFEL